MSDAAGRDFDSDRAGGQDPAGGEGDSAGEWAASWEAHRERQRQSWMDATPAQRLAWLEAALALAHRAGALPRDRHSGR